MLTAVVEMSNVNNCLDHLQKSVVVTIHVKKLTFRIKSAEKKNIKTRGRNIANATFEITVFYVMAY